MSNKLPSEKPTRLRSGVELPAGVPVLRAELALTGPDLPPGSKFVGITFEKPQTKPIPNNVAQLKPKSS